MGYFFYEIKLEKEIYKREYINFKYEWLWGKVQGEYYDSRTRIQVWPSMDLSNNLIS